MLCFILLFVQKLLNIVRVLIVPEAGLSFCIDFVGLCLRGSVRLGATGVSCYWSALGFLAVSACASALAASELILVHANCLLLFTRLHKRRGARRDGLISIINK